MIGIETSATGPCPELAGSSPDFTARHFGAYTVLEPRTAGAWAWLEGRLHAGEFAAHHLVDGIVVERARAEALIRRLTDDALTVHSEADRAASSAAVGRMPPFV